LRFERYKVEIEFTRIVVGGLPKHPDVIEAWVKSRAPAQEADEIAEKIKNEVGADYEMDKKTVGFKSDTKGVYLEDRNIKACLREAKKVLQEFRGKGAVAKNQQFQHGLFIEPERIYFMREGKIIKDYEGAQERTIHVLTRLGPRSTLKREELIKPGARLRFEIEQVIPGDLKEPVIPWSKIRDFLILGGKIGLGASRSQQFGKYKLISFKPV